MPPDNFWNLGGESQKKNITIWYLEAVFGLTNLHTKQFEEKGADFSEFGARVQAITDFLQDRRSKREFKGLWEEV